jgi:DNA-directed RNA polymerase subunit H (RpoH/RPB5)
MVMRKLKSSDISNVEIQRLLLETNLKFQYSTKLEFVNEEESKKFFQRMKIQMELLPEFLKPKR